jgi:hypothetical protein
MKHEKGIPMKHLNIAVIMAVLSATCVGIHGQELTHVELDDGQLPSDEFVASTMGENTAEDAAALLEYCNGSHRGLQTKW